MSDLGRPPHFDGTNFPYWHVRMSCFLKAKCLGIWRVTKHEMNPIAQPNNPTKADEKELHLNAIAWNSIFESLSIEVFNRVYELKSAHEIWTTLIELHNSTSDVKEQKYSLIKEAFDSFQMLPDELANYMYSLLNVIVNELDAIAHHPIIKN
uniref:DUF4219 domain-containing protein n=1 Tax=Setaria italica TaxID=4555 RepID=K3YDI6_SETIT